MGDDLVEPKTYQIFLKDVEGVAAILQGEDEILHAVPTETPTEWTLTNVDREKGTYTISDTKSKRFLGIKEDSVDVSRALSLSDNKQEWIIKKADDGFVIGCTLSDGQFGGWTLPSTGGLEVGAVQISILRKVAIWVFKEVIVEAQGGKVIVEKVREILTG